MSTLALRVLILIAFSPTFAHAAQGPASASGACSHVIGPIGSNGQPIEFTCEDVGGRALLVWNSSQSASTINITGGIKAVSFFPTDFTLDGTITSSGTLALIGGGAGGGLFINGSVIAPVLLIAAVDASLSDVKTEFLGPGGTLTSMTSSMVYFGATSKVKAKSGNLVVVGSNITNDGGELNARNGSAIMKTGTKLSFSWDQATWLEGTTGVDDHSIVNNGKITAGTIHLEVQRTATSDFSIINTGTLSATHNITFVTGTPGQAGSTGVYSPLSFGIDNTGGQVIAAKVTISPYYKTTPGGTPQDRTFNVGSSTVDRASLQTDIAGSVFDPTQDNTPAGTTSVINNTFTPTASAPVLVIPQLAVSMSHMNATATKAPITLAKNDSTETIRGGGNQPAEPEQKPRVKAKPVLVRGAFFDSKISAKLTAIH